VPAEFDGKEEKVGGCYNCWANTRKARQSFFCLWRLLDVMEAACARRKG